MDAVNFLDKWNKICAYIVDDNDKSCKNCVLDDICGKLCSKPGEVTKEECEEFVKKVNEIYEENDKNKQKKCCVTCVNFLDKQMGFGLYCNVCDDYSQWIKSKEEKNESI